MFPLTHYLIVQALSSALLSAVMNYSIDSFFGHKGFKRTPYTHSILGSFTLSLLITLAIYIMCMFIGLRNCFTWLNNVFLQCLSIAFSHLLLDSLTVDGVYPLWPFSRSKIALTHRRYDYIALNLSMQIIAVVLIALYIYYRVVCNAAS